MKVVIASLVLSSCAATMVTNPGGTDQLDYAPVNEQQRSGMVKYLNQGADFVIKGRRQNAYKQMHDACGGAYQIDSEGPQAEGQAAVAVTSNLAWAESSQYWYIRFSCVE